MKIQPLVAEIMEANVWRPRPFLPKPLNFRADISQSTNCSKLTFYIRSYELKRKVCQFSSISGTDGFKIFKTLGELTRNDLYIA